MFAEVVSMPILCFFLLKILNLISYIDLCLQEIQLQCLGERPGCLLEGSANLIFLISRTGAYVRFAFCLSLESQVPT